MFRVFHLLLLHARVEIFRGSLNASECSEWTQRHYIMFSSLFSFFLDTHFLSVFLTTSTSFWHCLSGTVLKKLPFLSFFSRGFPHLNDFAIKFGVFFLWLLNFLFSLKCLIIFWWYFGGVGAKSQGLNSWFARNLLKEIQISLMNSWKMKLRKKSLQVAENIFIRTIESHGKTPLNHDFNGKFFWQPLIFTKDEYLEENWMIFSSTFGCFNPAALIFFLIESCWSEKGIFFSKPKDKENK